MSNTFWWIFSVSGYILIGLIVSYVWAVLDSEYPTKEEDKKGQHLYLLFIIFWGFLSLVGIFTFLLMIAEWIGDSRLMRLNNIWPTMVKWGKAKFTKPKDIVEEAVQSYSPEKVTKWK